VGDADKGRRRVLVGVDFIDVGEEVGEEKGRLESVATETRRSYVLGIISARVVDSIKAVEGAPKATLNSTWHGQSPTLVAGFRN